MNPRGKVGVWGGNNSTKRNKDRVIMIPLWDLLGTEKFR